MNELVPQTQTACTSGKSPPVQKTAGLKTTSALIQPKNEDPGSLNMNPPSDNLQTIVTKEEVLHQRTVALSQLS